MLETLDTVDWGRLTHAAGAADDVPDLIRMLLSDKASVRERAIGEDGLWGVLCHQDSLYEATAPAVPFLLELVRNPQVKDRGKILDLLADFALGGYDVVETETATRSRDLSLPPDTRPGQERAIEWTRQTRAAVQSGRDIYLQLLDDRIVRVRQGAIAVLVAACKTDGEAVAPILRRRFSRERNREQRASLVQALAAFTRVSAETHEFLTAVYEQDTDELARLCAADVLAKLDGERTRGDIVETLAQAMAHPDSELAQAYESLDGDIAAALRYVGQRGIASALRAIAGELARHCATPIDELPLGDTGIITTWREGHNGRRQRHTLEGQSIYPWPPVLTLTSALLRFIFVAPYPMERAAPLTDIQRQALALILGCDSAWRYDLDVQQELFTYGIPYTRNALRVYLEQR